MKKLELTVTKQNNIDVVRYDLGPADVYDDRAADKVSQIGNIIPFQYSDEDGKRSITSYVKDGTPIEIVMKKVLTKKEVLCIISGLASAFEIGAQGVPVSYIVKDTNHIYVNEDTMAVKCLVIPIKQDVMPMAELPILFRKVVSQMRFDDKDTDNYVAKILTLINSDDFSAYKLKELAASELEKMGLFISKDNGLVNMADNNAPKSSPDVKVNKLGVMNNMMGGRPPMPMGAPQGQPPMGQPQMGQPGMPGQPPMMNGRPPMPMGAPQGQPPMGQPQMGQPGMPGQPPMMNGRPPMPMGAPQGQPPMGQPQMGQPGMPGQPPMMNGRPPMPMGAPNGPLPVSKQTNMPKPADVAMVTPSAPEMPTTPIPSSTSPMPIGMPPKAEESKAGEKTEAEETPVAAEEPKVEEAPVVAEEKTEEEEAPVAAEESKVEEAKAEEAPRPVPAPMPQTPSPVMGGQPFPQGQMPTPMMGGRPPQPMMGSLMGQFGAKPVPHIVRKSTGEAINITKSEFAIGKSKTKADYTIDNNPAISRVHCIIVQKEGVNYIKDNNSTNHTYVNGVELEPGKEVLLKNKTVIQLGDEEFTFLLRKGE